MSVLLTTASFIFDSNIAIENYEKIILNSLNSEFPFVNKVTLPANAPTEIPRFILSSHHGFSTIVITSNMIQLTTRFNNEYKVDWEGKCKPYLEKKISLLYKFFKESGINIKYSGVTINATTQTDIDSVKIIENKFIKKATISNLPLYDVLLKQTFVFEDKYFVNLQLQNQRFTQNDLVVRNTVFGLPENPNIIGILLDVNDRKIANSEANYFSSKNSFDKILSIINKIINYGFDNLINGEETVCLS